MTNGTYHYQECKFLPTSKPKCLFTQFFSVAIQLMGEKFTHFVGAIGGAVVKQEGPGSCLV